MKKLFQLLVILSVSFAAEILADWIPLPIPGCVYGMVLMLVGLVTGVIPLPAVEGAGRFLLEIMPVMFVPAAVGLLDAWPALQGMWLPCLIALVPVTLVVMAVSGHVTQWLLRRKERRQADEADPA